MGGATVHACLTRVCLKHDRCEAYYLRQNQNYFYQVQCQVKKKRLFKLNVSFVISSGGMALLQTMNILVMNSFSCTHYLLLVCQKKG